MIMQATFTKSQTPRAITKSPSGDVLQIRLSEGQTQSSQDKSTKLQK